MLLALVQLLLAEVFFGSQEEMLLAFQQELSLVLVRPTLQHFLKGLHHMLNHMETIDHNLRVGKQSCTAGRNEALISILTASTASGSLNRSSSTATSSSLRPALTSITRWVLQYHRGWSHTHALCAAQIHQCP